MASLGSLVLPSDKKNRHNFERPSLVKESSKENLHEIECITTRGPPKMFRFCEKRPNIFPRRRRNRPAQRFWISAKIGAGGENGWKAAHAPAFVVRKADFSRKWCNCATFYLSSILLVVYILRLEFLDVEITRLDFKCRTTYNNS